MTEKHDLTTDWAMIIALSLIALALAIGVSWFFPPAHAAPYIEQGCKTVYQGERYDMSGIYGFSGKLGWWKLWYEEGSDEEEPDKVVDLNKINYFNVTIDDTWNLGNWYQWDGANKNNHGNTFVFRVVPPNQNITWKNVSINASSTITTVPTTQVAPTVTIVVTAAPTPEVTAYFDPSQVLATQVPTPTPIMVKRSPVDPMVPMLAVAGIALLFARWRKVI